MNLQPAVDKLCVTCLAVPPYMETGVSEYSRALPRGKEGERRSEGVKDRERRRKRRRRRRRRKEKRQGRE